MTSGLKGVGARLRRSSAQLFAREHGASHLRHILDEKSVEPEASVCSGAFLKAVSLKHGATSHLAVPLSCSPQTFPTNAESYELLEECGRGVSATVRPSWLSAVKV